MKNIQGSCTWRYFDSFIAGSQNFFNLFTNVWAARKSNKIFFDFTLRFAKQKKSHKKMVWGILLERRNQQMMKKVSWVRIICQLCRMCNFKFKSLIGFTLFESKWLIAGIYGTHKEQKFYLLRCDYFDSNLSIKTSTLVSLPWLIYTNLDQTKKTKYCCVSIFSLNKILVLEFT
jgi:hypothetical protein